MKKFEFTNKLSGVQFTLTLCGGTANWLSAYVGEFNLHCVGDLDAGADLASEEWDWALVA